MKRIDNIIADIKNVNKTCDAWIYDDEGNIRQDVICGSVLPLLEDLKEYEINATENAIQKITMKSDRRWNTYNWNANIDHHIDVAEMEINGYTYMTIMVHRYGDVRANYTDRFLVRFDSEYEWFELESRVQMKSILDRYIADIDIMCESYNVYDSEAGEDLGDFYEIELGELLKAIAEKTVE